MVEMAVQVVVSPFIGVLFEKINSLIRNEIGMLWGVDKEMKKLASTLSTIQDVLEDAEEKQVMNKAVRNWLLKLKDATYEADDILDEWGTQAMQAESRINRSTSSKKVCYSFLSCFHFEHIKFRHKIAKRMAELRENFDEMASERSKFHLREGVVERRVEFYQNRETSSILTDPHVYGRDDEKEYIVDLLVNCKEDLFIYPILGIGGLGKTTLAQLVYNDEKVNQHFELRIWVYVSEDFDGKSLSRSIIVSISGFPCVIQELDTLQRCLREKVAKKRFLLVLDDIWNEDQEKWDVFKSSLRSGAKGSSIILTTRLKTVASFMGTCPPYCLNFLSDDDCWSLFKQRAFGMGNEESPNMVKIGKEILKKCGGVPLAAKVLGGLLRFKVEESEWLFVRDSGIWDLPQSQENIILPALRLSYSHLAPHLRQCFAYCAIFPKGRKLIKEELVLLWMANGLFQSKESVQLEDTGNEIFNALLWRSMFQEVQKDEDGNILSCKMHDLVHDLARSVSMNECSSLKGSQITNVPERTRHLSLTCDPTHSSSSVHSIHQPATHLRTLVCFPVIGGCDFPSQFILSTFKSLRALSFVSIKNTTLPDSIGILTHLRYLNFSHSQVISLPESVCELRYLETLKLRKCMSLQMLPKHMMNMSSLRHLDIDGCNKISEMPIGIGQLTCLQTLSKFIVGSDNGRHINELEALDHLRGDLKIRGLHNVRSSIEAKEANLIRKKNLHSLSLIWPDSEDNNHTDVIEGLQPHSNMRRMSISGYQGQRFPSWLDVSSLPNLVKMFMHGFQRCTTLGSLGELPLLKSLTICAFHSLKLFSSDGTVKRFPALEELKLDDMPELTEWCSFTGNGGGGEQVLQLPSLKKLDIQKCSKLTKFPLFPSLESLCVDNCNEMILASLKDLPRLISLDIQRFSELVSFQEVGTLQNLTALQSLCIWECTKLKTLPKEVGNLSKLTTLRVLDCTKLVSLPEEMRNLSALKSFTIRGCCDDLESLPELGRNSLINLTIKDCSSLTTLTEWLRYQTALRHLRIDGCPKLELSNVEFQHLVSLRTLKIGGFPALASLPEGIQHLCALENFEVWWCFALVSVPDWIGRLTKLRDLRIFNSNNFRVFPDGLQHLVHLETLIIKDCTPELHARCQKETGEDWHKIRHIPDLRITPISKS